jgi:hypothetical protein
MYNKWWESMKTIRALHGFIKLLLLIIKNMIKKKGYKFEIYIFDIYSGFRIFQHMVDYNIL